MNVEPGGGRLDAPELAGTALPREELEGCDRVGAEDPGCTPHDGKIFFISKSKDGERTELGLSGDWKNKRKIVGVRSCLVDVRC